MSKVPLSDNRAQLARVRRAMHTKVAALGFGGLVVLRSVAHSAPWLALVYLVGATGVGFHWAKAYGAMKRDLGLEGADDPREQKADFVTKTLAILLGICVVLFVGLFLLLALSRPGD